MLGTLGGFLLLAGTPLAFVFSLIGLIRGIERTAALRGLLISGGLIALVFLVPFITRCFR